MIKKNMNSLTFQAKILIAFTFHCFCNKLKSFISARVVIRGDLQDDAMLCTEKETFDLKLAETSNTMLLTPNTFLPKTSGKVWHIP